VTTIDNNSSGRPSIAVDGMGRPHVSYARGGYLYYAHKLSGNWVSELVDSIVTEQSSISTDKAGKLHIAYITSGPVGDPQSVKYAWGTAGSWQKQVAKQSLMKAYGVDLEVDANGGVHLSFVDDNYDTEESYLRYGYRCPGD